MPHSFKTFDRVAERILATLQPRSILDIGCGAGKYGALATAVVPAAKRIAPAIHSCTGLGWR